MEHRNYVPAVGFTTEWTGSYPCLCHGEWKLYKDGKDISDMIPSHLRTEPMDTYGEYDEWHFGDDWEEIWETYEDGWGFSAWYSKNETWVRAIAKTEDEAMDLYGAFQANDWRYGSCGGCI